MTDSQSSSRWSGLLAGRWQIPTALLAVVAGGAALLSLTPKPPPKIELDAVLADVGQLETNGDVLGAATALQDVLATDERALDPETKAGLHERLADLLYRNERRGSERSKAHLELMLAHEQAAEALGRPETPELHARRALAEFWLGRPEEAIPALVESLGESLSADTRDTVLESLVDAVDERTVPPTEVGELLDSLLESRDLPPAFAWWAVKTAVDQALADGAPDAAKQIVAKHADTLASAELEGYGRYLDAAVAMAEGRVEDAYPGAWWVESWIPHRPAAAEALDRFAGLPALNRTLLGSAQLASGEPAAALESFNQVLSLHPGDASRTTAVIGKARALDALKQYEAARRAVREGLESFKAHGPGRHHAAAAAFAALLELGAARRAARDLDNAIAYFQSAVDTAPEDADAARYDALDALALAAIDAAGGASDPTIVRAYRRTAGEALARLAALQDIDDNARGDRLWSAAVQYDAAGELEQALPLLERFLDGRRSAAQAPEAMLLLGQVNEGLGRLNEALDWYEQVISQHDNIDASSAAEVRAARTLISLGPAHFDEAENRLVRLMNAGRVTPAALIYRDALLTLAELLDAQQRYGAAIARFEEFQRLYPEDERQSYLQFRIANAYRLSALALRSSAEAGAAGDAARNEAATRLEEAADAYTTLLEQFKGDAPASGWDADFARLALLYRGDCLFERGSEDSLKSAYDMYQAAALRLEGRPEALTAYVQMAVIRLRQERRADAALLLERAQWLLKRLPDDAFTRDAARERSEWERFFEVTLSSTLLRDVLASRG